MAKGYTTKSDIEDFMLKTIDTSFDARIAIWIEAIENYIDKLTGRNFVADSAASVKKYDGDNYAQMVVDDFILDEAGITVVIDGATIASTDYLLYPANGARKNKVALTAGIFTRGQQNIEITAKWGYSEECPADVRLAATTLVAGVIGCAPGNKSVRSESIGSYSVSYDSDTGWQSFDNAMKILSAYKKYTF
jgi:hypothetical protein